MWRNAHAIWRVMRDSRISAGELRKVVHERLRHILVTAYATVPHYRRAMQNAGYDPTSGYRGPQDLRHLPILTRQDLHSLATRLMQKKRRRSQGFHIDLTSGSAGIPVKVYRDAKEQSLHIAKWLRVLFKNGYRIHHRVMAFMHPRRMAGVDSVVQKIGLLRRKGVDYFLPTGKITDHLFSYRPQVLYGNRCHLELVALNIKERGLRCDFLSLMVVTGEVVHANTRRLLRQAYGVEPVESYGSVEMGVMAHETPDRNGLHLLEDQTFFEFLDERDNPVSAGTSARLIATDLSQTLMPLIRYDQGDRVVFEDPVKPPGAPFKRLKKIIGRDDDYILMPDGSRRAYIDFSNPIAKVEGIHQFRIVQQKITDFRVEVVVDRADFDAIREKMACGFEARFPPPYRFSIHRVRRIEPDPSGKIRKLISELSDRP